jgi:hypothetical protein
MRKTKQRRATGVTARILLAVGAVALALSPTRAWAHDNLGGDELAVANWMLVGAMITIVLGILWGIWAIKTGQFNNVESSKYTMLENAEDYDAIMAEYDAKQRVAQQAVAGNQSGAQSAQGGAGQADKAPGRKATEGKTASA